MRIKMGTVVPKVGTIVHLEAVPTEYRQAIATALIDDLGMTHRAIKTAMAWTGASERTVKYWLAAERGPSGEHLIALARHSDSVFLTILLMADRLVDEDADVTRGYRRDGTRVTRSRANTGERLDDKDTPLL